MSTCNLANTQYCTVDCVSLCIWNIDFHRSNQNDTINTSIYQLYPYSVTVLQFNLIWKQIYFLLWIQTFGNLYSYYRGPATLSRWEKNNDCIKLSWIIRLWIPRKVYKNNNCLFQIWSAWEIFTFTWPLHPWPTLKTRIKGIFSSICDTICWHDLV